MTTGDVICAVCGGCNGNHFGWCSTLAPLELNYVQTIPGSYCPLPQYGWICPRCEKVNAPDVRQCDCKPGDKATVSESDMPTVTTTVWPDRGKVVWTALGGEGAG